MRQYLDLVRDVLENGEHRSDRTGVGTISLFGLQSRYDLRNGFPILTTKRVNFAAVVQEILWFLRGETNIRTLGNGIWTEWANSVGDIGPMYGKQMRHWGGEPNYLKHLDECNGWKGGVDQIANAYNLIRNDPQSRRIVVSAWNVDDLPAMALAPCHAMFQFYCTTDGCLDLQLYQRSADTALGAPFNIASYALLLEMMAKATGKTARYFVHTFGDAHIYQNHVDGLRKQLSREPGELPRVELLKVPDFSSADAFNITPEDIVLTGYNPAPAIKFPIAV